MKKHGTLNSEISCVLSRMGHTDTLCVGDCGLPIPDGVKRIDLSLTFGVPSFIDVLKTVLEDMKVEKIVLAEEIIENNPKVLAEIKELFHNSGVKMELIPHASLKHETRNCKAIIRTGETTPFANIILQSGCIFAK